MEFRAQRPSPESNNSGKLSRREALQVLAGLMAACATPRSHETPLPYQKDVAKRPEERESLDLVKVEIPKGDTFETAFNALSTKVDTKIFPTHPFIEAAQSASPHCTFFPGSQLDLGDHFLIKKSYTIQVSLRRWQETRHQAAQDIRYREEERGLTVIEAYRFLEQHPEIIEEWKRSGSKNIPFMLVSGVRFSPSVMEGFPSPSAPQEVMAISVEPRESQLYIEPLSENDGNAKFSTHLGDEEFGTPMVIELPESR